MRARSVCTGNDLQPVGDMVSRLTAGHNNHFANCLAIVAGSFIMFSYIGLELSKQQTR
jgi:hypothetical protein